MIIEGLCRDTTSIVFSFLSIKDCIFKFGYNVQLVTSHPKFTVSERYLRDACESGYRNLVELMIEKGANEWNSGLYGACYGGHRDIVELMIEKGATLWNWGLWAACRGGQERSTSYAHRDLTEFMIKNGANYCWSCGGINHKFY
jgi:hypothetical protein